MCCVFHTITVCIALHKKAEREKLHGFHMWFYFCQWIAKMKVMKTVFSYSYPNKSLDIMSFMSRSIYIHMVCHIDVMQISLKEVHVCLLPCTIQHHLSLSFKDPIISCISRTQGNVQYLIHAFIPYIAHFHGSLKYVIHQCSLSIFPSACIAHFMRSLKCVIHDPSKLEPTMLTMNHCVFLFHSFVHMVPVIGKYWTPGSVSTAMIWAIQGHHDIIEVHVTRP